PRPSEASGSTARVSPEQGRDPTATMLEAVRAALAERVDDTPLELGLEPEGNELRVRVGATHVVSVRVSSKRGRRVRVVVGFCSTRKNRDPAYRRARKLLETTLEPRLEGGWQRLSRASDATDLVLETFKRVAVTDL